MTFSIIVTDSALWEQLGYQILADKVLWDRRGNPKKPVPSFDKVVQKSPAQVQSKKTRAHKTVNPLDKPAVVKASALRGSGSASKPFACPQVWGTVSPTSVAKANPPAPKRKANKGKDPLEEPLKKAQVDKSLELLSLVSSVKSDSIAVSFGEPRL